MVLKVVSENIAGVCFRRGIEVGVASGPSFCKRNDFINPIYYRPFTLDNNGDLHGEKSNEWNTNEVHINWKYHLIVKPI